MSCWMRRRPNLAGGDNSCSEGRCMKRILAITFCLQTGLWAQEASSGFELRVTASEQMAASGQLQEEPRDGSPVTGGFRAMLYPTWKIDDHWSVTELYRLD